MSTPGHTTEDPMTCQSKTSVKSVTCSDAPEMFRTTTTRDGQLAVIVECLDHAIRSETKGLPVEVIRH